MSHSISIITGLVLAGMSGQCALAQQTAFSYSGVLYATNVSQTGSGPAIGTFDFRCSLWPSVLEADPLNRVGPTNAFTVTLSSGAFATNLNFGPLTGGPYFLQTEVRRSGPGSFKILAPRKQILPVPLAQHAHTASNLLGTLPDARLSPNVALLNASPAFAGTVSANGFVGDAGSLTNLNGAALQPGTIPDAALVTGSLTAGKIASGQVVKGLNGLTDAVTLSAGPNVTLTPSGNGLQIAANSGAGGLSWQVVSGTSQQAQANTGYLLTNNAQVTVTLPAAPNPGDVVRISGTGGAGWKLAQNPGQSMLIKTPLSGWTPREINRSWQCLASSADGTKLVAGGLHTYLYTSSDSGVSWTSHESIQNWQCLASSADGTRLIAGTYPGQLYTSADSGETWTPRESTRSWFGVASSTDGIKLVAVAGSGDQIYTSTDAGVTWTPRETARFWYSVASSADGTKLVAGVDDGKLYTSTDSGQTWTPRASNRIWSSIASSADGSKLFAGNENVGRIYVSTDSGVTWTGRAPARNWISVACSSDGTKIIAASYDTVGGGELWFSSDSGSTWTPRDSYRVWYCVASSADGNRLIAGVFDGQLYLSASASTLGTLGYLLGEQYAAVEFQYIGNGQFILLSHEGSMIPF